MRYLNGRWSKLLACVQISIPAVICRATVCATSLENDMQTPLIKKIFEKKNVSSECFETYLAPIGLFSVNDHYPL